MKREEYYIREAQEYAKCGDELTEEALAFIAGMKMADSHPNWIKANSEKQPDAGQLCVISPKTLGLYYLARWNERTHIFEILDSPCGYYRFALNCWFPIVLPIEEDEE